MKMFFFSCFLNYFGYTTKELEGNKTARCIEENPNSHFVNQIANDMMIIIIASNELI